MVFGWKSSAEIEPAKAFGSPTAPASATKAGSYLRLFPKSFSSSALVRNSPMVADEDMSAMTIDFLWTRLQSQRAHYKAEKQRAQVLVQKLLELEHKLRIEVQLRKQAERRILGPSASLDCECIGGPPQNLSLRGKCKGSQSIILSSEEDFYGHADDVYTDGDEASVFNGCPSPRSGHPCAGSGNSGSEGKMSFWGLNDVHHGHPYTCLDKDERKKANPEDLRSEEQDEVDRSLHGLEHDETSLHRQGSDFIVGAREVPSFRKGGSSLAHDESTPPITNLQQPPGHLIDMPFRKETCEIVEESTPDCLLQETGETLVPHTMMGDNTRRQCPYDYNTRAAIHFPGIPRDICKLPCQIAEDGDCDMALRRPPRVHPVISHRSCEGCHAQVGLSQHVKWSGCSKIMPWPYLLECKHMGSRLITKVKGSAPKRREHGHSLSLGRVGMPSECARVKEVERVNYKPEPVYSMKEVLSMLEFTKHICAFNGISRLKLTDEDGNLVADGHCPIRSWQQNVRRSQSSLRFLIETAE